MTDIRLSIDDIDRARGWLTRFVKNQDVALVNALCDKAMLGVLSETPSVASETKERVPFEKLMERQMAESPVFLPLAIQLLNTVKAWRDCDDNDGFPHEVREQIDALLTAYELREQEKRRG